MVNGLSLKLTDAFLWLQISPNSPPSHYSLSICFNNISKIHSNFSLKLNMANCKDVFSPLSPETEGQVK